MCNGLDQWKDDYDYHVSISVEEIGFSSTVPLLNGFHRVLKLLIVFNIKKQIFYTTACLISQCLISIAFTVLRYCVSWPLLHNNYYSIKKNLKEQLILFLLTSIQNSNCLYFVMSIEIRLLLNTKSIAVFTVVSSICSGCKKMVEG